MTDKNIDELIDAYAWHCVDDMTLDELRSSVAQSIAHDFETETEEYIIEQIKDTYPELLQ